MYKKHQKNNKFRVITAYSIVIVLIIFGILQGINKIKTQDEYTYYGIVPNNIWRIWPKSEDDLSLGWKSDKSTWNITEQATLMFLGYQDGTTLQVRHLGNNSLIYENQINTMQKALCYIRNGTKFIITSNHPMYVLFISGYINFNNITGPAPQCFHPSITGSFTGKEFMLIASDDLSRTEYRIIALEQSTVTITDEDNNQQTLNIKPNDYKIPYFTNMKAYKIESTGNIMITSGAAGQWAQSSYAVPCVQGIFKGTTFYTRTSNGWNRQEENGFVILAYEDTKMTIYDLITGVIKNETQVQGGSSIYIKPVTGTSNEPPPMAVIKTNKPVTMAFTHEGSLSSTHVKDGQMTEYVPYGRGLMYMGVIPNEEEAFYLPLACNVQAYIFAYETANIQLDGISITIQPNNYVLLQDQGIHTIVSNRNLIVQILHWPLQPPNQGLHSWSVAIPCLQTVSAKTEVTLTPLGGGWPILYIIAGVAVAIIAIAVIFIMRRRG